MSKLKVLVFASVFMRPNYEIGSVWNLKQCQAYIRNGADVLVICPVNRVCWPLSKLRRFKSHSECPLSHVWDGVRVEYPSWFYAQNMYAPALSLFAAWFSLRRDLDRIILEFEPDIVHAHFSMPSGYMARKILETYGVPYALTDHNAWIADHAKGRKSLGDVYRYAYKKAAVPISITPYMREKLLRVASDTKFVDIYNGTDPVRSEILERSRPSERSEEFSIFSCGSLNDRKGHHFLIRAFSDFVKRCPEAKLRIAGVGPMHNELQKLIDELELGDAVRLLGMTAHAQVLQEMVWADCFVLASWAEPFATVYLEAMSAGVPMVWTSDGGINAVLRDGQHGVKIDPKSVEEIVRAFEYLYSDVSLRARISSSNCEYFRENLTWDRAAGMILNEFAKVI